jgi:hypothetical protein
MRQAHQIAVITGRIDHHEIVAVLEGRDCLGKRVEFRTLVVVGPHAFAAFDAKILRNF